MTNRSEVTIEWTQKTIDNLLDSEPILLEYEASVAGGTWWQTHVDTIRQMTSTLTSEDVNEIKRWRSEFCNDDYVNYALQFFETLFNESMEGNK